MTLLNTTPTLSLGHPDDECLACEPDPVWARSCNPTVLPARAKEPTNSSLTSWAPYIFHSISNIKSSIIMTCCLNSPWVPVRHIISMASVDCPTAPGATDRPLDWTGEAAGLTGGRAHIPGLGSSRFGPDDLAQPVSRFGPASWSVWPTLGRFGPPPWRATSYPRGVPTNVGGGGNTLNVNYRVVGLVQFGVNSICGTNMGTASVG